MLRYLLLIFMLTFSEARGENDLSQMEDAGLLMPAERTILESLPRKAQSVAGWLLYHFHSAAEMAGGRWGGKHYERKLLLEQIFKLRGMVGDSHMCAPASLRPCRDVPARRVRPVAPSGVGSRGLASRAEPCRATKGTCRHAGAVAPATCAVQQQSCAQSAHACCLDRHHPCA